jgi:phenylacetate-CoA ligase
MFLSKFIWQAYRTFAARPIGELDRFAGLAPALQRYEIAQRLLAQLRYFGSRADALPQWREAMRIRDPEELWNIWPSLPVMTKSQLNARFEPVEMQRRFGLRGRINATGGSTGEPTRFFLDTPMLRASRGAHLYSRLKMGWRPGMPTIVVWGSDRDIGKQSRLFPRMAQKIYRNRLIPGFEIGAKEVREILATMRSEGPVAIYGYSSLLQYLAERTLADGAQIPRGRVATAWNGGEMLYDYQVQTFRRAFGVPVLNRYGGRELSVTAFQESEEAPLRVLRPWIFLEIVDDSGKTVAPGETGRLLLTSTICRGTPFLRYEVGDLGSYRATDSDESGISRIATLDGRNAGSIRLNDGRTVSSIYWNHLLKDYPEVNQFQVRVKPRGQLSLVLVGKGFSEDRSDQLKAVLRLVWKEQPVDLIWTRAIPRSAQGKLAQVVHES